MTETTPEHLRPEVTQRGFTHLPSLPDEYGGTVRVYESSAARSPHIWLAIQHDEDGDAQAHLTLESAERLRDQLTYLIENHYQVRS